MLNVGLADQDIKRYVLIDDFCGSGDQATEYSQKVIAAIRAAASRAGVAVELCYYVLFATVEGLARIRADADFDRVGAVYELDSSYRTFDDDSRYFRTHPAPINRDFAHQMCQAHGSRLWAAFPLGYHDGQLMIGFHHNTPDNTLPVMWCDSASPPSTPMFPPLPQGVHAMTDTVQRTNPFQITKAVDFSDEEIVRTWVDLPHGGFSGLANPSSRMPLFLLGGKGSGRTHLMRYFSAVSQQIRNPASLPEALSQDGYIGVYVRCSGLNSGRFDGKGQTNEASGRCLRLLHRPLAGPAHPGTVADLLGDTEDFRSAEERIAHGVLRLFDLPPVIDRPDVTSVLAALHELQRELDIAINNAALTRELPVTIRSTGVACCFRSS